MKSRITLSLFISVIVIVTAGCGAGNNDFPGFKAQKMKLPIVVKEVSFGSDKYALENGTLKISQENIVIWESSREWWIDDLVLADSNNDGVTDLNLSVWKSGNFGGSKPFWVKGNDMSVKNHFFVFDFIDGKMKPIWQSSNLDAPNCEFEIRDVDGDLQNDLLVVEGDYSDKPMCVGKYTALWKWNGWGFSNEWRRGFLGDL